MITREEDLRHRKKHFQIDLRPAKFSIEDGEVDLSITKNGYQWTTISLLENEVKLLLEALTQYKSKEPVKD